MKNRVRCVLHVVSCIMFVSCILVLSAVSASISLAQDEPTINDSGSTIYLPLVASAQNESQVDTGSPLAELFHLPSVKAAAVTLPDGFVLETVVSGLTLPTSFNFAPEGRIYVTQKAGRVRVIKDGSLIPASFINLSGEVNQFGDRGLLSVAVHPDFPTQPYLYLLYTYDPSDVLDQVGAGGPDGSGSRVARLLRVTASITESYNSAVFGSTQTILGSNSTYANIGDPTIRAGPPSCEENGGYVRDCLPIDEVTHTIGTVRFAEDGSLFVSNGDGSNFVLAEPYTVRTLNLDSLAGKLLRIDAATGNGLPDNPFFNGDASSNRSKVYSYGLRNPFRFTFHPINHEPIIGDVGWNTWEEVNTGRGANFGWPCYEGGNTTLLQQGSFAALARCQSLYSTANAATPAIYAFSHPSAGSAVVMGEFYTGDSYPQEYQGALFFSDFNQGIVRTLILNGSNVVSITTFATGAQGIVQMRRAPDGNLYWLDIYEGKLLRLRYTAAGNHSPVAQIDTDRRFGAPPLTVNFTSSASFDPDAQPISITWGFGDGSTSIVVNPQHTYLNAGVYTARLTVTDLVGASDSVELLIGVGNSPPVATILAPITGTTYAVGDLIQFSGAGNDAEQGGLTANALIWTLNLHHNDHIHPDALPPTTGSSGNFTVSDHGDHTWLELCLSASDNSGLSGSTCVPLEPRTVDYTLASVPESLSLPWEGASRTTSYSVTTIVSATQQLIAPMTQSGWQFCGWSDGGAAQHLIKVGNAATTVSALYRPQHTQTQTINGVNGLQLNGEAVVTSGVLSLTGETRDRSGSAFLATPFALLPASSFSTRFQFRIDNSDPNFSEGGDGMTFIVQGVGPQMLGATGRSLGYGGIARSMAVEIDTLQSNGDPNGNHVAVLVNGDPGDHRAVFTPTFDLEDAQTHTLWVDYDGVNDSLAVYLSQNATTSKPQSPDLALSNLNLHELLGNTLYAGFSAATSALTNTHQVNDWSFTFTPPPTNLPPQMLLLPDQSNRLGDSIMLFVPACDANDTPLTFTAGGLPSGLSINAQSGVISGVIAIDAAKFNPVTLSVSDGTQSLSHSFVWRIDTTQRFDFSDFADFSMLQLNGRAEVASCGLRVVNCALQGDGKTAIANLRLTEDTNIGLRSGSAFLKTPLSIHADTSFSTRLVFGMNGLTNGGDGMAFVIQGMGANALGRSGGGIGYSGIASSLAVEIDTHQTYGDADDNHVAVLINGKLAEHLTAATVGFDLNDGQPHTLWVEYDGASNLLRVYLAQAETLVRPLLPILTQVVDMPVLLGNQAYFGFTAAVGGLTNAHEINKWSLKIE